MLYSLLYSFFTEASEGTFYSILNGKQHPMYNDAEEDFEDKLRLEGDLNEVVIGHWKSHDGVEEYYSKVGNYDIFWNIFKIYETLKVNLLTCST